ncbi:hypothetical protein K438DRAFT_1722875 [Mycena galopus ATCC 62051]|nr:hypothetical protein K438DRAFT_1722875 [Mycena galopus ATCC 62051]
MSERELYGRLLLAKGHGYPLSHPQPSDDLPPESRVQGIQIGDVGVLTSDGGFDALFNICRAPDDPANRHGVPVGFETVHLGPTDVLSRGQYHRPGSHVSNENISKRRLDVDTDLDNVFSPVGAGAVIEISTVSKQAAILLMPEGASRINLRFLDKFRRQALKHAQNWYEFLKSLGCMVEHDELYLVTGIDKCASWIVGAVDNQSRDCNISLKLKATQIGSTSGSYAWQWQMNGAFADSGPRRPAGEDPSIQNQTVFIRGFRIAIHIVGRKKIAQAIPVVDSKPLTMLSRRWFASFSRSPSLGRTDAVSRDTSHGGGQAGSPREESETIEYYPEAPRPYHPADAINKHLLGSVISQEGPLVAVTHDDEWVSVLRDDDEMVPEKAELIGRIFKRYTADFIQGGTYLRVKADERDAISLRIIVWLSLFSVVATLVYEASGVRFAAATWNQLLLDLRSVVHLFYAAVVSTTLWYICLAFAFGGFLGCATFQRYPLYKLDQLEQAIQAAETILELERIHCMQEESVLQLRCLNLAKVKLSASKIRERILTLDTMSWREYLDSVAAILRIANECSKRVKEIEASIFLSIKAEGQDRFASELNDGFKRFERPTTEEKSSSRYSIPRGFQ